MLTGLRVYGFTGLQQAGGQSWKDPVKDSMKDPVKDPEQSSGYFKFLYIICWLIQLPWNSRLIKAMSCLVGEL